MSRGLKIEQQDRIRAEVAQMSSEARVTLINYLRYLNQLDEGNVNAATDGKPPAKGKVKAKVARKVKRAVSAVSIAPSNSVQSE